jgi:hypothetical protein
MANARQEDKSAQGMEDATRRAGEKAAEQTSRIGQAAADETLHAGQAAAEATEEVARASATLLKQNVETLQSAWRFGLETATSVIGRSTEQFGRTLRFGEQPQDSRHVGQNGRRDRKADQTRRLTRSKAALRQERLLLAALAISSFTISPRRSRSHGPAFVVGHRRRATT